MNDAPANPPELPPSPPVEPVFRPLRVLRDTAIVFFLTAAGGFGIGVAVAASPALKTKFMLLIGISNIVLSIVGFTLAGCLTRRHRWPHLGLVALGLWLTGLINLAAGFALAQWFASVIVIAITAAIGGGIAALIRPEER